MATLVVEVEKPKIAESRPGGPQVSNGVCQKHFRALAKQNFNEFFPVCVCVCVCENVCAKI